MSKSIKARRAHLKRGCTGTRIHALRFVFFEFKEDYKHNHH